MWLKSWDYGIGIAGWLERKTIKTVDEVLTD